MPSSVVPGVRAGLLAHRDELLGRRPAAGHRLAVAVAVRGRLREREARARRTRARGRARRASRRSARASPRCRSRRGPSRSGGSRSGRRGSPAFTAMPPSKRSRNSAKRLPLPVGAVLERGEGHALDLRHHAAQVVGVAVAQRREGEAAVAADHGGDAVRRSTGSRWGPTAAGRRSACAGRRSRARRRGRWRRSTRAAASSIGADRDDPPVARCRRRRLRPGAPVPSTTVPPLMTSSSMGCPRCGTGTRSDGASDCSLGLRTRPDRSRLRSRDGAMADWSDHEWKLLIGGELVDGAAGTVPDRESGHRGGRRRGARGVGRPGARRRPRRAGGVPRVVGARRPPSAPRLLARGRRPAQ